MTAAHPTADPEPNPPKPTLMSLPVEIRCEIYDYVLEEPEPIKLRIQFHKKQNGPHEIVRTYHNRHPKHRGQVWDNSTRSWIPRPFTHSSILLVNHQINMEATPILFAKNCYFLESTTALKEFLELIGETRARHLRYVNIAAGGYRKTTARAAFKALTAAKGLRALEVDHANLCSLYFKTVTANRLADDCKALLKSLKASYETLNLSRSVLDVLSVSLAPCAHWVHRIAQTPLHQREHPRPGYWGPLCRCTCGEAEEKNLALQREVRTAVAKYLGLDEPGVEATAV